MSDIERSKEKRVPFYKLFSFADELDIALMIVGSICAIGNGMSQPVMALLFGSVVDVFGTSDRQNIVHNVSKVCLKIVYLALGNGVAACLQGLCWTITGERQVVRLQGLYLKAILRQEITYFDTKMANEKDTGVMPGDGVVIKDAICEKLGKFIQLLSVFFGGFIFAFMKGWLLALALVSIIPALMIAGISMAISISKLSTHTQAAFSEAKIIVEEQVRAIRTVSSFNGEDLAIAKYNRKLERASAFLIQQRLVSGLGFGMVSIIVFGSYGLAIWYGCKLIIEKGYSGGQIISILGAMIFSGMALSQTSPCLNTLAAAQATYKNMFEMIQRRPQIDANDTEGMVMENIKGEIELKDVYFRYPSRPGVEIFSGLSLRIPSERITALVGKSGSGKSTVINLLERFYDPDAGEILIDGINLKKLQLGWLRKQIGLVGQEPVLFATTIKENMVYGRKDATDDEIRVAIESANAAAFIDNLPKGWDTMIGDHGAQLSGGQRQRITIARVILKNPRVFLLDEATSALDAKSEQTVKDALLKVMTNRTTLVITHRLSSVENADNIAVIHHGKIVEQGTHTELTKGISGLYYYLVCSQGANQEGDVIGMHRHRNVDVTVESQISSTERSLRISRHSNRINESEGTITVDSDGKDDEKHCNVNIKRLASLCKQQLPILLLGSIAASLHGLAFPIFGYLFAAAIKAFYEPHNKLQKDSRFWALMYVVLGSITMLAVLAQHFFFGVASGKLIKQICSSSFKKIIHQESSWFDDPANSSGAVGARLSTNALALQSLMGNGLALMVQNIAAILAGLVLAFVVNRTLAAIVLALATIVVLQSYIQIKCLGKFSTDAKVLYEEQSQVAGDAIRSMKTVASFCAESKVLDLYQRKSVATMKYRFKLGYISSIAIGVSRSTFYFANALCFLVGAILVQHHKATVLEVVKVYLALTISAIGVVEASGSASHTKRASGLAASVFEILDSKPKIDSSTSEGLTLPNFVGDIEFRNVSFKYPSRPNVQIFDDLCLSIPNGKTVVVVGESGNGKSTIINLLERFYDVNSGCILLDGIEIQKFNLFWLRQQIGLVSQEPILFNDTIHANIAYGNQGDIGIDKIVAAAKTANAHNFITALPQGYGTLVGDRGVQLSGGQKQRIAIARAIVKDPKIFLLDEATSALDAESENIVQEALNCVIVNKTTVFVTHRLSSIRESDMIAFLRNGVIVEQGRHDELMKIPNGAYATMVVHYMNPHM